MSVQSQIDRLNAVKNRIRTNLAAQGITVPADTTLDEMATLILSVAGYTPEKGVDYWTPADQEAIVQQVIAALGTPVFGRVDADNNIILTGELADGTYTIKYEDAEGEQTVIGTLNHTVIPEPTYTNVIPLSINADGTQFVGTNGEDGYKTGTRLNSSGAETSGSTAVTGFIPATVADKFYFRDIDLSVDTAKHHRIAIYDASFTYLNYWDIVGMYSSKDNSQVSAEGVSFDENGKLATYSPLAFRYIVGSDVVNKTAYIRVVAGTITENSIITKNEPIV